MGTEWGRLECCLVSHPWDFFTWPQYRKYLRTIKKADLYKKRTPQTGIYLLAYTDINALFYMYICMYLYTHQSIIQAHYAEALLG